MGIEVEEIADRHVQPRQKRIGRDNPICTTTITVLVTSVQLRLGNPKLFADAEIPDRRQATLRPTGIRPALFAAVHGR